MGEEIPGEAGFVQDCPGSGRRGPGVSKGGARKNWNRALTKKFAERGEERTQGMSRGKGKKKLHGWKRGIIQVGVGMKGRC